MKNRKRNRPIPLEEDSKGNHWIHWICDACGREFKTTYGGSTERCPYSCGSTTDFREKLISE